MYFDEVVGGRVIDIDRADNVVSLPFSTLAANDHVAADNRQVIEVLVELAAVPAFSGRRVIEESRLRAGLAVAIEPRVLTTSNALNNGVGEPLGFAGLGDCIGTVRGRTKRRKTPAIDTLPPKTVDERRQRRWRRMFDPGRL